MRRPPKTPPRPCPCALCEQRRAERRRALETRPPLLARVLQYLGFIP